MLVTSATNPKRGRRPFGVPSRPRWPVALQRAGTTALARLRAQQGFTLIEVLVATALSLIVFTAVLSALATSQHTQSRDQEWALVIQEGRTGLARMAREMRQAYSILEDSHSAIEFYARIGGKSYEIRYDCAKKETGTEYDGCVRQAAEFVGSKAPSSLPEKGTTIVRYVTNQASVCEAELLEATQKSKECVFQEYTPNAITPDLVTIKVRLPASGTLKLADALAYKHHIVLENGAYIRDMALGV